MKVVPIFLSTSWQKSKTQNATTEEVTSPAAMMINMTREQSWISHMRSSKYTLGK